MSSKGRGRGRGAVIHNKPLPKPGGPLLFQERLDSLEMVTNCIKSLPLEASDTELVPVADMTMKLCNSEENKEKVFNVIYLECQKNWKFSCSGAALCKRLVAADESFRTVMLVVLRKDYLAKEELHSNSEEHYLGWLSLFCQIFVQVSTEHGEPMKVLAEPIVQVLEETLTKDPSNESISCCANQFLTSGRVLHSTVTSEDLDRLLRVIRNIIVNGEGTKDARLELVEALEGVASDWSNK